MTMFQIPITNHPELPDEVPLVADFHDMRNRLSYYYPILRDIDEIKTPITKFFSVDGNYNSYPQISYREERSIESMPRPEVLSR